MSISHVKVKLYGESFQIHSLEIKNEYADRFYSVVKQFNEPLNIALLNVNFFRRLNLNNHQTIQDLIKNTFSGLISNNKSQIEIWIGRKRVEKMKLVDLFYSQTLFPLFQTQLNDIGVLKLKSGLFLEEKEIGLIAQYEIKIENFNIDLLTFNLTKVEFSNIKYELLSSINYKGRELPVKKNDALLRHQNCFLIK